MYFLLIFYLPFFISTSLITWMLSPDDHNFKLCSVSGPLNILYLFSIQLLALSVSFNYAHFAWALCVYRW